MGRRQFVLGTSGWSHFVMQYGQFFSLTLPKWGWGHFAMRWGQFDLICCLHCAREAICHGMEAVYPGNSQQKQQGHFNPSMMHKFHMGEELHPKQFNSQMMQKCS